MPFEIIRPGVYDLSVYDPDLDLFESQFEVPQGISYNSYLIWDEKVAVLDTVDKRGTDQWLQNLADALQGRSPDYLIVSHAEPDHAANIARLCGLYPTLQVVGNARTWPVLEQFFGPDFLPAHRRLTVAEGDTLPLGHHCLRFIMASFVHWPEVMVSYEVTEQILFSADAFGRFGQRDPSHLWRGEARHYYANIVGRYAPQVRALLQKASALPLQVICPLHGPVLQGDAIANALRLYTLWSRYQPEEPDTVLILHASIHGHTAAAARYARQYLQSCGVRVRIVDLTRVRPSWVVGAAFLCGRLLLLCPTYDGGLFPAMEQFLSLLKKKNYQNRIVGLVENGSWNPWAANLMRQQLAQMPNMELRGPTVTLHSTLTEETAAALRTLCDALRA